MTACVDVDDGREHDAATGGTPNGGGAGGTGGTGGSVDTGGSGGTGGSPDGHGGEGGEAGVSGHPRLDVDAIFRNGCATASAEAQLPQFNVLFVLDRSQSMLCNPDTPSAQCEQNPIRVSDAPSKWEITQQALSEAIKMLPAQTEVGISYFSNDDVCGVHSRPRVPLRPLTRDQVAALDASLFSVVPGGATPLVGATILAYKHLHDAALEGRLHGESFVVLLTDGQQSDMCTDPDRCDNKESCTELLVDEEVVKASSPAVNIRTFVIGVPGSEPVAEAGGEPPVNVLSQIAINGGTAREGCDPEMGDCHFDMSKSPETFAVDLALALEQIVGRVRDCELPLPEGTEGADLDMLNVVYSSSLGMPPRVIPRDDTMACDGGANGWRYAPGANSLQLCGSSCEDVRHDPAGLVDVVLGCPVQGPQ